MRFLHFSICVFLFCACRSAYHELTPIASDDACANRLRPKLASGSLYHASVDVTGHHLSGLLLMKQMPDSTWRAVFTNEAGVTFVDMELRADGTFKVHQVVGQLDRKPVLTTLYKDFALVIGLPFAHKPLKPFRNGDEVYFQSREKKESYYFITFKDCASLHRMERGSARKKVVSVDVSSHGYPTPEQLMLKHHTFNMQIKLSRIERE